MSEQLATAQPEAFAPEATSAPAAEPAPASQAQVDTVKANAQASTRSLEDELGDIFDKNNAPAAAKAAPDAQPVSDQPEKAEPEPAQSSPAIAAPHSWSAEAKADWAKLPPTAQAYIAQRESEAHKAITQAGNELKTFQPLRQAFDQSQGYYPQGQEANFVASLMQANAALHHDPVGTLKQLAEYYRVDPAQLTGQKQQPATDTVDDLFRDPRLDKEVMPLVQTMAQRVQQLEGQLTARQRAETEARQADASKAIAEFSKDKPDFADLHDDIVREVSLMNPRMPMEKRLAEAYDRARWANPENRQRILDEQRRTEAEKTQKEAAAKQAEAKKHASMNVRSGANAPTPSTSGKWNDESNLGALYDRITARG